MSMTNIPHFNQLPEQEAELIRKIKSKTAKKNLDNITRTNAYLDFYLEYPEMIWSFLASMVSRNGGYNMCDLEGEWFPKMLDPVIRNRLFLTYERANWLIFRDAYAQLLLYSYSTKRSTPMFHLLRFLDVSAYMEKEWKFFWKARDKRRLMTALIINEQNVIQEPVINEPVYKKRVFNTSIFMLEDYLHFSTVLFPTCAGELYGASVHGFKYISNRINLGKQLASILFDPRFYSSFLEFAVSTEHTGSRHDYEQFFSVPKKRDTPFLRCTYPIIRHHYREQMDWYVQRRFRKDWEYFDPANRHPIHLTKWYKKKQKQLHALITIKELFTSD
ncbi:hypothetical protein J2S25_000250 [Mesobacillus stamsii]|nr:hypothetical protein [Mesobacillus stamsii]